MAWRRKDLITRVPSGTSDYRRALSASSGRRRSGLGPLGRRLPAPSLVEKRSCASVACVLLLVRATKFRRKKYRINETERMYHSSTTSVNHSSVSYVVGTQHSIVRTQHKFLFLRIPADFHHYVEGRSRSFRTRRVNRTVRTSGDADFYRRKPAARIGESRSHAQVRTRISSHFHRWGGRAVHSRAPLFKTDKPVKEVTQGGRIIFSHNQPSKDCEATGAFSSL